MPSTRESRKRKTVDRSNDFVDASFSESDDLPLKRLPNPPSLMTTQNSRGKQGGRGRGRGRGRGNGRGNGTESGRAKGGQLDEATTGIHASQSVSNPTPIGTNDATLPIDRNDGPTHGISESVQQDPSRDDGSDSVGAASLPTPKPSAEGFHLERSASNNTRINAESSSSNSSSISDDESNESTPLNDPSDRNACSEKSAGSYQSGSRFSNDARTVRSHSTSDRDRLPFSPVHNSGRSFGTTMQTKQSSNRTIQNGGSGRNSNFIGHYSGGQSSAVPLESRRQSGGAVNFRTLDNTSGRRFSVTGARPDSLNSTESSSPLDVTRSSQSRSRDKHTSTPNNVTRSSQNVMHTCTTNRSLNPPNVARIMSDYEFQMYVKRSFESLKLWARSINEKMEDLAQQKERLNVADMEEYEAIENEFSLPLKSLDELSDMERRINTSSERHKLMVLLARSGEDTVKRTVYKVMDQLLHFSLAAKMSVTGKSKGRGVIKQRLLNYQNVVNAIKGSIRVHDRFKRTTDGQIIEFISKWLRHAPENWQRMIDRSAVNNGSGEEPYDEEPYEEEPYEDERAF